MNDAPTNVRRQTSLFISYRSHRGLPRVGGAGGRGVRFEFNVVSLLALLLLLLLARLRIQISATKKEKS